jgi:bacillithiol biosynthesis deacetylase BshB1
MKLDILAIGVHPDDVELSCSGTLLKHIEQGYKVGILDLTQGQLGTRGTPELRLKEAQNSAKLLGIAVRENLGMEDGYFVNDFSHQKRIIEVIRKYRPEIVLANAVTDRHPDHGRAAKLIADACFYSGLRKIETQSAGKNQDAWRPKAVYHYIQDYYIQPDFIIDITPYFEKKKEAILAFSSQFYNPANKNEPETPISSKDFLDFVEARARNFGRIINATYGEGFTASRPMGVNSLLDLK